MRVPLARLARLRKRSARCVVASPLSVQGCSGLPAQRQLPSDAPAVRLHVRRAVKPAVSATAFGRGRPSPTPQTVYPRATADLSRRGRHALL